MDARRQQVGNDVYNSDKVIFEFVFNICVASAGSRTWTEKRMGAFEMDESISVNFTEFAVTTFIAKFGLVKNGGIWPDDLTADMVLHVDFKKAGEDGAVKVTGRDLAEAYKAIKNHVRNVCLPAFSGALTEKKEIPSGKQLKDVLEAIIQACWTEKEEKRCKTLKKSREKAAAKAEKDGKAPPKAKASAVPLELTDPTWCPLLFPAFALYGDMATDKHANFVLHTEDVHGPKRRKPVDLSAPAGAAGATGAEAETKYGRRRQRQLEMEEKTDYKEFKNFSKDETRRAMASNLQMSQCLMRMQIDKDLLTGDLELAGKRLATAREMWTLEKTAESTAQYKAALQAHQAAIEQAAEARAQSVVNIRQSLEQSARMAAFTPVGTGSGTGAGTGTSSATLSDVNRQVGLPSDDGSDEEPGKQARIEENPYCNYCGKVVCDCDDEEES